MWHIAQTVKPQGEYVSRFHFFRNDFFFQQVLVIECFQLPSSDDTVFSSMKDPNELMKSAHIMWDLCSRRYPYCNISDTACLSVWKRQCFSTAPPQGFPFFFHVLGFFCQSPFRQNYNLLCCAVSIKFGSCFSHRIQIQLITIMLYLLHSSFSCGASILFLLQLSLRKKSVNFNLSP